MTFTVVTTEGAGNRLPPFEKEAHFPPLENGGFILSPLKDGGIIFPPLEKGGEGGLQKANKDRRDMELLSMMM